LGFLVIYAIAFIYILLTADNFFSFSPISAYAEIVLNLPRALQQIFQQRSPTLWFMHSDLYKAIEEIVLACCVAQTVVLAKMGTGLSSFSLLNRKPELISKSILKQ